MEELKDDDRTLVVVALQALHHERIKAWNIAFTASELSGKKPPSKELFGICEAEDALRRIGAAPRMNHFTFRAEQKTVEVYIL